MTAVWIILAALLAVVLLGTVLFLIACRRGPVPDLTKPEVIAKWGRAEQTEEILAGVRLMQDAENIFLPSYDGLRLHGRLLQQPGAKGTILLFHGYRSSWVIDFSIVLPYYFTLGYNLLWIVLGLVIAVAFAIMMSELSKKFVAKTYQTLMFFPYFLSWVVVSYFLNAFIDAQYGLIPMAQRAAGETAVSWYTTPGPWPYIIVLANLWKNVGYSTVLYLAAITGIDQTQYEAAAIDGASKWQQILHVTLPNLRTMIAILFILNVGKIFNADFGLFWNVPMQNGALFSVTQVIDTYIYRVLMNTGNIGQSTAAGLLQNIVGFICIIGANAVVKKIDSDSTLF